MVSLLAAGAVAATGIGKELFNYNRENFKFDQDQRLERESLRLEMQIKRFELFREDLRDLVELTVDRMDVYHLVGALFLEFCVVLFCEGRVQASAPPFLLSLFLLSNACSFIYLLLAVWLSMHASIASHSFGVRLLTRFVRLPIPSVKQMNALTMNLKDYEKQGIANLLKMPFVGSEKNKWYDDEKDAKTNTKQQTSSKGKEQASDLMRETSPEASPGKHRKYTLPLNRDDLNGEHAGTDSSQIAVSLIEPTRPVPEMLGRSSNSSSSSAAARPPNISTPPSPTNAKARTGMTLLSEDTEHPLGGDDMLYGQRGLRPERHIQLFRQLQSKWQCYDAYCRVCMGLGVNLILQALSYFSICHTLVENRSPSTGYGMTVLFQATTIALAVLDLAGLKRREILVIQLVGIMPCFFTAWGVAHGRRSEEGILDPDQEYALCPFAFLCQVVWLELWIRVAAPSSDKAKLPRRFRQVLFLDVFGDAVGWDPTVAEEEEVSQSRLDRPAMDIFGSQDDVDEEAEWEALSSAAKEASSQLSLAQWAMRRWRSCPSSILSRKQANTLRQSTQTLATWGATVRGELDRLREKGGGVAEFPQVFEPELRRLQEIDDDERAIDPFAGCLVGPFEHDGGDHQLEFHFNVEECNYLWHDDPSKLCSGALLLTLDALAAMLSDLERDARRLLELRIITDLKAETRRQKAAHRAAQSGLQSIQEALPPLPPPSEVFNSVRQANMEGNPVKKLFPNVIAMFKKGGAPPDEQERAQLLRPSTSLQASPEVPHASPSTPTNSQRSPEVSFASPSNARNYQRIRQGSMGSDPTLVAMAGQHARHFVPERLPWQVLKGMTRVLQLCWGYAGLMALLKEAKVYTVDFGATSSHERRLVCSGNRRSYERMDVEWPHGPFFRPHSLFCNIDGDTIVGSPYALFSLSRISDQRLSLLEIDRSRSPPATVLMCHPEATNSASPTTLNTSACLFVAPSPNGLSFWPFGYSRSSLNATTLSLEGSPWRQLTGGIISCRRVESLLLGSEVLSDWCMILIGWDGEMLPIAILPLPSDAIIPTAGTIVTPTLDAPFFIDESSTQPRKGREIVSLSFEAQRGHLWAISNYSELELWDLLHARSLGRSKFSWPAGMNSFRPSAMCESAESNTFFVVGASDTGPALFSMRLEDVP